MLVRRKISPTKRLAMIFIILVFLGGAAWIVYDNFFSETSFKVTTQKNQNEIDVLLNRNNTIPFNVAEELKRILYNPNFFELKINVEVPIRAGATGRANPFMNFR